MLEKAARALSERAIPCEKIILADGASHKLPLDNAVFDVVLSFYSLEHLHPLSSHLEEIARVLKPGGILAGAIPAEGGLAWGLGRLITSRPDLMRAGVNVEKIVCWEHPNLACEVLQGLRRLFTITKLDFSPLFIPLIDCNLTIGFIARKKGEPHA